MAGAFRLLRGRPAAGGGGSFITPGTTVFGGTWAADTYSTPEGSSGADGYSDTPSGCNWTCDTWQESIGSSPVTISCVGAGTPDLTSILAGDVFCNMKQFDISVGNGPYYSVIAPSVNPVTGKLDWSAQVRASDVATSGVYEVRARARPKVGQPFLMQGADPTSSTMSYQDTWSTYVVLDKGDLPRLNIYKAPNNDASAANDATNTGLTSGSPVYKWSTAFAKVRAHASYPNVIVNFYMLASQDHEWGSATEEVILESGYGWTTFQPAPGLTASDVKINRVLAAMIPCRKFQLKNVSHGDVSITNEAVAAANASLSPTNLHFRCEGIRNSRAHVLDTAGTLTSTVNPTSTSQVFARPDNMIVRAAQDAPGITLPTLMANITIHNTGAVNAFVVGSGSSGAVATTGDTLVAAGATVNFPKNDFYAYVTASGSTTLQITGVNANYGQPTNPDFIGHQGASQRVEWVNCDIAWAGSIGLYQSTLMTNVTLDHIANHDDLAPNCKCIRGLTITNVAEGALGNHLDAIQPTSFTNLKHRWFEDITATAAGGWFGQFIHCDTGNIYNSSVFLRLKSRSLAPDFGTAGSYKNNRIIFPDMPGGGQVSPKGQTNPSQPWTSAPFASNYFIYDNAVGGIGNVELLYRQGVKHIYPFSTRMPQTGGVTLPQSTLLTTLGSDAIEIHDLDVDEYVGRIHHDDLDPPTFYSGGKLKIRFLQNAVFPEGQTDPGGGITTSSLGAHPHMSDQRTSSGDTSATSIDAKRPISIENAHGAHRAARFSPGTQDVQQGAGKVPGMCMGGTFLANSEFYGYISGTTLTVLRNDLGFGVTTDIIGFLSAADFLIGAGVTAGTTIVSQLTGPAGGDGTYQVSASQTVGNAGSWVKFNTFPVTSSSPCELWWSIDNNHIAQQVASGGASTDLNTRLIRHFGSGDPDQVYLARQTIGGLECFVASAGQTDGTTKAGIQVTTSASGVSAAGPGVVRVQFLSDGIQITFWNAATGSGGITPIKKTFVSNDATKPTLSHVLGGQQNFCIGSSSVITTGVSGTFCGFDLYAGVVCKPLTTKAAAVLADLKARVGVS